VRDWVDHPHAVSRTTEQVMRYALGLARLRLVRGEDGEDYSVEGLTRPFRSRIVEAFRPMLLDNLGTVEHGWLEGERDAIAREIDKVRTKILERTSNDISPATLEREITRKELVLVGGGGGGCGYVYLGAFDLLEHNGIRPSLIVGSSIGAVLGLFRARQQEFNLRDARAIAARLRFPDVFEYLHIESRYGLPAGLRMFLHRAVGREFLTPDGKPLKMSDLPIPFESVVTGIRAEAIRHELAYYEDVVAVDARRGTLDMRHARRQIRKLMQLFREMFANPRLLREIVVGREGLTHDFDALDAIGFSAAIPGVIHYDVLRADPTMHKILPDLLDHHRVARLVDGGVVNNVPSRVAWESVQGGRIGTRNVFILAFDCFTPQFRRNLLFHPIQRMIVPNVARGKRYAHVTKAFKEVLSPLDLVPPAEKLDRAIASGYRALGEDLAYIRRMLEPVPVWEALGREVGL